MFFQIKDGHIRAFNGSICISTPTDLTVTATPKGTTFIKAIEKLPDESEIVLNLTAAGRLSVKSGNFKASIECLGDENAFPIALPDGPMTPLEGGLMAVLKKVSPFMGVDASRSWSRGVLLRGQSAIAANNIVLIEHWLPTPFPIEVILPADAVREMIRIGVEPIAMQLLGTHITFHYPSGAWLLTSTVDGTWPDLTRILNVPDKAIPVPAGFFDGVHRLADFTDKTNRVYFRGGTIATSEVEDDGATVDLPDFGGIGCHYLAQVAKLDGIATSIDLTMYPLPCIFYGDMLRGAIAGMRMNDSV